MSSVNTTKPHGTTTSVEQARVDPEPAPGGFLESAMQRRSMDDLNEGTQSERDLSIAQDEKALKNAVKNLVNSWQERLQLISVITTFFASTEAAILVNATPVAGTSDWTNSVLRASNASLLGALILHVYASVLSFLGAFLLISYKLKEATREEMIAEGVKTLKSPFRRSAIKDVERDTSDLRLPQPLKTRSTMSTPARDEKGSRPVAPPNYSHMTQIGPFKLNISSLLSRTHALCVFLAATGFVLAIAGVLCYSWARQPEVVSVFASTCLVGSLISMVVLFV